MIRATLIGYIAIMIWSADAMLTTYLTNLPPLEVVTLLFTVGFSTLLLRSTLLGEVKNLCNLSINSKQSILFASLCLFCLHLFYIQAFKYAEPLFADLINYLWPLYLFILTALFHKKLPTINETKGLVISTIGMIVLFWPQHFEIKYMITEHLLGYFYAFLAGLSWAIYNLYFGDPQSSLNINTMTLNFGLTALLALIMHLLMEPTVTPQYLQLIIVGGLGVLSVTFGYFFWNYGIQYGNNKVLSILSYQTPLISIFWLILFGKAEFTLQNISSAVLITIGTYFCLKSNAEPKQS